uniref:Secreted protein n=1 Tax=Caenorhabditis japonica TaxID=281687 RepID=A0A8R1IG32_CAEJA
MLIISLLSLFCAVSPAPLPLQLFSRTLALEMALPYFNILAVAQTSIEIFFEHSLVAFFFSLFFEALLRSTERLHSLGF